MTRNFLIVLTIILSLYSCKQAPRKEEKTPTVSGKHTALIIPEAKEIAPEQQADTVRLDFGDFLLLMPDIEVYRNDSIQGNDTIVISPELGYDLDSQVVIFRSKANIKSVEAFECFKTALSIPNEGPHLDLYDWKGYESNWTRLMPVQENQFMMSFISEKEASKFPEFTKEELVQEADRLEKGWGDLIKRPSPGGWKDNYWTGVGIRRIKFVLTTHQGKVFEKYLVAYLPMGC
jgi:hypothetical protein